jgi:hypothetical protein
MEKVVDPVATVSLDDRETLVVSVLRDNVAHITVPSPRLALRDRFEEALVRRLDQVVAHFVHLAHQKSLVQVAVIPFVVNRNVNVDNVAFEERAVVRDAMTNHLIHRGAARLWEINVVERRRVAVPRKRRFVADPINLSARDAGSDRPGARIQDLASESAHCAHLLYLIIGETSRGLGTCFPFTCRLARIGVVWALNLRRYLPSWCLGPRSERTGKLEIGPGPEHK